jgi:protein TonB
MNKGIQTAAARRRSAVSKVSLVMAMGLVLAACGSDEAAPSAGAPAKTAAPAAANDNAVSAEVVAMTPAELREAASTAFRENRLYAPAGNNAVEYYLALRDKQPGDAAASSALTDLLPMTVIAIEQSVSRDDFAEAKRLSAMLEKADPQHPALARLKTSIAAQQASAAQRAEQQRLTAEQEAKRQAELEQKRLADQKKQQEDAARQLAAQQAAERRAAEQRLADQQANDQRAAEQRAAEQRAAEQRASQARTAAAQRSAPAELRALSTPAPRFPPEALRAGQSGEVQVEFTVEVDGSVSNVRVVRANPPRVFDREAVNAVKRWRFQPLDAPQTTRRTIGFVPEA